MVYSCLSKEQDLYHAPVPENRYNETVALIMAVFWLFLYIFVNLTSILYLGAVAINGLTGGEYLHVIMMGLAVFALLISLGGMKVVAYTDVIQVAVLIIGGLVTTYIALTVVGQKFGVGANAIAGFKVLMEQAPEHFKMIIPKPTATSTQNEISKYLTFPGALLMLPVSGSLTLIIGVVTSTSHKEHWVPICKLPEQVFYLQVF